MILIVYLSLLYNTKASLSIGSLYFLFNISYFGYNVSNRYVLFIKDFVLKPFTIVSKRVRFFEIKNVFLDQYDQGRDDVIVNCDDVIVSF